MTSLAITTIGLTAYMAVFGVLFLVRPRLRLARIQVGRWPRRIHT